MTIEALRAWLPWIPVGAAVISLSSLGMSLALWRRSNRPVVTAFIQEHAPGNLATAFNLVVSNTGARPATNVRLHVSADEIEKLFDPKVEALRRESIKTTFSVESEIPLLRNAEELTTSFGAVTSEPHNKPWLRYGSVASILITYKDLDGRAFKSRLPLKVYTRRGFGGGTWSSGV